MLKLLRSRVAAAAELLAEGCAQVVLIIASSPTRRPSPDPLWLTSTAGKRLPLYAPRRPERRRAAVACCCRGG